mgnify:CR=1 FL=1
MAFSKELGGTYFQARSIDFIFTDYSHNNRSKDDNKRWENRKGLFGVIRKYAGEKGHVEDSFKQEISQLIYTKQKKILSVSHL